MSAPIAADLCVIGAGSGGLSVAAGAAQLGVSTVLIERGRMGGDCLNTGCVPSKALLAAAKAAAAITEAGRFGITAGPTRIDFGRVHDHVHQVIAGIAPHDSVERFEGLGVRVIQAEARFVAPDTVAAGDVLVKARRFVVATGSRPALPALPGLAELPHLTNETVFERRDCPAHLIVIGGGPIGAELAQAHRRLGAQVTVLEMTTLLPKDDPELVDVVRHQLVAEGIDLREGAMVLRVERAGDGVAAVLGDGTRIEGSDLLIAAGRRPNVEGLGLDTAGVALDGRGFVAVDARLRTGNRRIFAIGDVAGGPQFTHVAGYHAGIVIRNALFRLPARVDYRALPWVTYTEPELAQVGLTEAAARDRHGAIRVLRWPFADNDRARAERRIDGLVKVITRPCGRVLGASIVGAQAGEQLMVWSLAIAQGLKVGAVANLIAPYPTLGEAGKRAAGSFFTTALFGPRTRRLVRFLSRFG
ncbi:MAG: dihydrolipoamide dehydrogenase [Azospirillum sp.]|nr:dihydrolipoamide dehydrogenase [Azospirillum sp.]